MGCDGKYSLASYQTCSIYLGETCIGTMGAFQGKDVGKRWLGQLSSMLMVKSQGTGSLLAKFVVRITCSFLLT